MTISKDVVTQLVIPFALVYVVLQLLHGTPSAGHPGLYRTLAAIRSKYYCYTTHIDIEKHISQCLSCAQTKGTISTAPILEYPLPAGPFDVVILLNFFYKDLLDTSSASNGGVVGFKSFNFLVTLMIFLCIV